MHNDTSDQYFDILKYNKIHTPNDLSIINLNIRSFNSNIEQLTSILSLINHDIDIITLTETWLTDSDDPGQYFPNYDIYQQNRILNKKKRGGGVAILIKKNICSKLIPNLTFSLYEQFDSLTILVNTNNFKPILLSVIYNSPESNKTTFLDIFYNRFNSFIFKNPNLLTIFCGDYNIDTSKNNMLTSTMQQLGQYDHINSPTRVSKKSSSILDKIFTNIYNQSLYKSFKIGILEINITDHMPTFINIIIPNHRKPNINKSRTIYILNEYKFFNDIKSVKWDLIYNNNDVNKCYDIFIETFVKLHTQSITKKNIKNNLTSKDNNWLTKSLKNAIKKKLKLYKIFIKNKTDENELRYKNYKKKLKNILKKEKFNYYQNEINKCETKTQYWNILNKLTAMKKNDSTITKIKYNNNIYNTDIEIANSFNTYFTTIGTNINKSFSNNNNDNNLNNKDESNTINDTNLSIKCNTLINNDNILNTNNNILNKNILTNDNNNNDNNDNNDNNLNNKDESNTINDINTNNNILDKDILTNDNNNKKTKSSFFLSPISETEIITIINKISSKTSKDFNNLDFKILKKVAPFIIKPLHYIFNLAFTQSYFPDKMKIAVVLPIYKKKLDNLEISNYRPISILPQFSKILEKLISNRIYNYMNRYGLFNTNQFGFLHNSNTVYASAVLTDFVTRSLDRRYYVSSLFLDLEKAFDTVDHALLLDKIYKLGFRGRIWKLIKSYLLDRYQCVKINGVYSSLKIINIGVPQGSILGPLLFILFCNDIFIDNDKIDKQLILFADDTSLTVAAKSKSMLEYNLNIYIKKLQSWFHNNKLKLNINKTQILNYKDDTKYNIRIDNYQIENVKIYKFLGIYIDYQLNFNIHISKIISKISKIIYLMKRVSQFLTIKSLVTLYSALILPHLIYSVEIWGTTYKYNINRLFLLQKRSLRIINKQIYVRESDIIKLTSTNIFYKTNRILKIQDLIEYKTLITIHKLFYKNIHIKFKDMFCFCSVGRNASSNLIRQVSHRSRVRANHILISGTILWNKLKKEFRNIKNVISFKKKLKNMYLCNYE